MSKWSQRSEVGSQRSEVRGQKSEVGSQRSEDLGIINSLVSHGSPLEAFSQWSIKSCWLLLLSMAYFSSCSSGGSSGGADIQARLDNKELKYFTNGKKLYTQHCSNCHMPNGEGLGQLIPPLKQSDYLLSDMGRAASIIVNGQQGLVVVNGLEYNQPMPANLNLNPTEVTEILTYISNSWGNEYGGVALETVKKGLNK